MQNNNLYDGKIIEFMKSKNYKVINSNLGEGSFGKTILVQDPYIKEFFVVKKFNPNLVENVAKFYDNFIEEIKILFKLNHKNIVRIFNYYPYEQSKTGFIIMEYIEGKSIDEFLNNYEPSTTILTLNDLFSQLIDAFECIEQAQIIHRDIRENNILINSKGLVKVIDFGIGKILQEYSLKKDSLINQINRPETLPQEYSNKKYSSKTDMFYLAELLNRLIIKNELSNEFSFQNILNKMMEKLPTNRYKSFTEIKKLINNQNFLTMNIKEEERLIYQNFSNDIKNNIDYFTSSKKFNTNIELFESRIKNVLNLNCLEEYIQNDKDLIFSVVNCSFSTFPFYYITVNTVQTFYNWFINLSQENKSIVLNNLIYKLSTIKEEIPWDNDIPF